MYNGETIICFSGVFCFSPQYKFPAFFVPKFPVIFVCLYISMSVVSSLFLFVFCIFLVYFCVFVSIYYIHRPRHPRNVRHIPRTFAHSHLHTIHVSPSTNRQSNTRVNARARTPISALACQCTNTQVSIQTYTCASMHTGAQASKPTHIQEYTQIGRLKKGADAQERHRDRDRNIQR